MYQIMGAFGRIINIRWLCQRWNELSILGEFFEMAVTMALCLLQRCWSRGGPFQTLTCPLFWEVLSRKTSPPPESVLWWAIVTHICVSHRSGNVDVRKKKFANRSSINSIPEGHEPDLQTKWAFAFRSKVPVRRELKKCSLEEGFFQEFHLTSVK